MPQLGFSLFVIFWFHCVGNWCKLNIFCRRVYMRIYHPHILGKFSCCYWNFIVIRNKMFVFLSSEIFFSNLKKYQILMYEWVVVKIWVGLKFYTKILDQITLNNLILIYIQTQKPSNIPSVPCQYHLFVLHFLLVNESQVWLFYWKTLWDFMVKKRKFIFRLFSYNYF